MCHLAYMDICMEQKMAWNFKVNVIINVAKILPRFPHYKYGNGSSA